MSSRIFLLLATGIGLSALAGCASTSNTGNAAGSGKHAANVQLMSAAGKQVAGTLGLSSMGDGVHLVGQISGLTPNSVHAMHIHETGDCSAADFSSAGGHFNPTTQPHGRVGAGAHHLGDQDNLRADANGVAQVNAHFAGVAIGNGEANDVLGKAVVVHADPDDYTSQPAGNAGGRIACGVIR